MAGFGPALPGQRRLLWQVPAHRAARKEISRRWTNVKRKRVQATSERNIC